jgi:hypothetical protein
VAKRQLPEAKVSADIRDFLAMLNMAAYSLEQGWRNREHSPGGTRQTPGLGDICVFGPDRFPFFGWIEVKAGKGKLRPSQQIFQEECRKANVPHVVAYCVTDVFDWLVEHGVLEAQ